MEVLSPLTGPTSQAVPTDEAGPAPPRPAVWRQEVHHDSGTKSDRPGGWGGHKTGTHSAGELLRKVSSHR